MEPLFIMTHGPVKPNPVGLAMSVLRRCKAFSKHGIRHTLLVNDHYVDFEGSVAALRKNGDLDQGTFVRYMHNDLAGDSGADDRTGIDVMALGDEYTVIEDNSNPSISRVYTQGKYVMFAWSQKGRVVFIDSLVDGARFKRTAYDSKGYTRKVERIGHDNKPVQTDYYGRGGNLYLSHYTGSRGDGSKAFLELHTPSGSVCFGSTGELIAHWLQAFVLPTDKRSSLISEYGFFRRSLQDLQKVLPGLRVIYTLHNNHLTGSNRYGAPVKRELLDFFNHIHEYDAVVVLTDDQKNDILKQFYPVNNITVIPHHTVEDLPADADRDPYRVVLLGRYAEHKGQIDAIQAFRQVVDHFPLAHLELYGRGPMEDAMRTEIEAQGLSENVRIMGFSNGSREVYSRASIGLFPTLYEGFGLSIQESMQYGCVPIAYDSKYGIRALIRDGVDGLVIDRSNVNELAASILLLLRNDKLRVQLASECPSVYERFSEKFVVDKWTNLLQDIHA